MAGWAWPGYKCVVVTCPRCGASRGDGDRFCADYGAPLGRCPSCRESASPGKRFCPSCWHALARAGSVSLVTAAAPLPAGQAAAGTGHLAPMQHARRGLARVRPATGGGDPATTAALASAPASLRELGSPYHFAPGLIDYGQYLMRADNDEAAAAVVGEAHDIADRLRCQPLLERAAGLPSQKRESGPR